ncbi:hypothetical protein D3C72_1771770 [compost metagenome]
MVISNLLLIFARATKCSEGVRARLGKNFCWRRLNNAFKNPESGFPSNHGQPSSFAITSSTVEPQSEIVSIVSCIFLEIGAYGRTRRFPLLRSSRLSIYAFSSYMASPSNGTNSSLPARLTSARRHSIVSLLSAAAVVSRVEIPFGSPTI